MSERAFGSGRVTTTSATRRDARAALKRGCGPEQPKSTSLRHDHPEFHRLRTRQLGGRDVRARVRHVAC
jgi:hypothetical protein